VQKWRYGLTLLPRENTSDETRGEEAVDAVVWSRRERGWELVRVTARDDAELLVFRRPA
jgi:hypothetical protein